jgi:Xaa-Pro dipeptidase
MLSVVMGITLTLAAHSTLVTPTEEQKELYRTAYSQITHNFSVLHPGLTFRDFAEKAWEFPERYYKNRYILLAHGCGMACEYPYLYHKGDFDEAGYDGVIEPGMVLCVES